MTRQNFPRVLGLAMLAASLSTSQMLVGCASRPPRAADPVPAPSTPARPEPSSDAFVRVTFAPVPVRYRLESHSAIFSAQDTTRAADSVTVTASVSATVRRTESGELSINGTVESMTVTSGLGANRTTEALQAPFVVEWLIGRDSVQLQAGATETGCDQIRDTARDLLVGSFPPVPDSLAPVHTWRGASLLKSCRGGYSLQVGSTLALRVTGGVARSSDDVTITSEGSLVVAGSGGQGSTAATIRGTGSALSTYHVDPRNGSIRTASSRATVQIEVDLGYRTDRFLQHTQRVLTRIDP